MVRLVKAVEAIAVKAVTGLIEAIEAAVVPVAGQALVRRHPCQKCSPLLHPPTLVPALLKRIS